MAKHYSLAKWNTMLYLDVAFTVHFKCKMHTHRLNKAK